MVAVAQYHCQACSIHHILKHIEVVSFCSFNDAIEHGASVCNGGDMTTKESYDIRYLCIGYTSNRRVIATSIHLHMVIRFFKFNDFQRSFIHSTKGCFNRCGWSCLSNSVQRIIQSIIVVRHSSIPCAANLWIEYGDYRTSLRICWNFNL